MIWKLAGLIYMLGDCLVAVEFSAFKTFIIKVTAAIRRLLFQSNQIFIGTSAHPEAYSIYLNQIYKWIL